MNWAVWERIEGILLRHDVRPILGVVPDNRDPRLEITRAAANFWERVHRWRAVGWTVAMHGYQHLYVTRSAGIVGVKKQSEFAGLAHSVQREKLEAAVMIFRRNDVLPDTWVAPGHSFDAATVSILKSLGFRYISDGLFVHPRRDTEGMLWIPQQLWRFHRLPFGVWTVCMHHNHWREQELEQFERSVTAYGSWITGIAEIAAANEGTPQVAINGLVPNLILGCLRARVAWQSKSVPKS